MSSQNNFSNLYTKKEANKPPANLLGCAAAASLAQIRGCSRRLPGGVSCRYPRAAAPGAPTVNLQTSPSD